MIDIEKNKDDPYIWIYLIKGAIKGGPNRQMLLHKKHVRELIKELLKVNPSIFVDAYMDFEAEIGSVGVAGMSPESEEDLRTFLEGWIRGWMSR